MDVVHKDGTARRVEQLDLLATARADGAVVISAVNKDPARAVVIDAPEGTGKTKYRLHTVNGDSTEAYNDIGHNGVTVAVSDWNPVEKPISMEPHSVNMIELV
ncbi:MAG: hypothetical protein ACK5LX_09160 [Oscillospiraceae bacterium]